jgi:4-amino-4-deoxy-L-arabinose transferase-like glycosyltransferase
VIPLLLVLLAAIQVAGIWWGLPGMPNSWAPDEFSPLMVHDAIEQRFAGGWHVLYPPGHLYILAVALAPIEVLAGAGVVEFGSRTTYTIAFYVIRIVSIIMAAGTAFVVFRLTRELFDALSGIFAALAIGLSVTFVFYAKLANVEVPYLFWVSLSLLYYMRILARHARRDYVLFAVSAALAIGTKDQASALYLLTPLPIAISQYRSWQRHGAPAPAWRALINGNTLSVIAAGAATLAVIHNLAFNWSGAVARLRIMTGPITTSLQEFPNTVAGHAAMLLLGLRHVQFSMGWAFFVAALAGILLAAASGERRRALALLVPIASYWIFLIAPLMYHYDRYLMPAVLILAVFAGHALSKVWSAGRLAKPVVAAGVLYTGLYAGSVDALMIVDGRYGAQRWMRENIPAGGRVMAVGYDVYLPRFDNLDLLLRPDPTLEELIGAQTDYLVTTSLFDERRLTEYPKQMEFFQAVLAGRTPYRLVVTSRGRPPFNLLDLDGVRTNLDKINPEIRIYRRVRFEETPATK